jgi:hypothetical protein
MPNLDELCPAAPLVVDDDDDDRVRWPRLTADGTPTPTLSAAAHISTIHLRPVRAETIVARTPPSTVAVSTIHQPQRSPRHQLV